MKPQNQKILADKFFISPTLKEFRQALALRNRRLIIRKMVEQEELERESLIFA